MCLVVCANYNDVIVIAMGVNSCVLLKMWLANADWSLLDVMKQMCSLYLSYTLRPVCPVYERLHVW